MNYFTPIRKLLAATTGVGALLALPLAAGAAGAPVAPGAGRAAWARPAVRHVAGPATSLACTPDNNALSFDGTDDYVRATGTLPATSQLTLEAWVNPASLSSPTGYNAILNGDDYIGGIVHWQLLNDGRVELAVGNGGTVNSTFTVPLNAWSHLAVVYSATAGTAKFYLNGVLQNTASTALGAGVGAQAYCVGA